MKSLIALALGCLVVALVGSPPRVDGQPPTDKSPAYPEKMTYKLGPDSLPRDGVPKGKLMCPTLFKSKVYEGTVRHFWIHVPAQYTPEQSACVLVFQDGQRATNPTGSIRVPTVLDNLVAAKQIPVTIGIFV